MSIFMSGHSSSSFGCLKPDPSPKNYRIIRHLQIGDYLLIQIRYLDCENYEGMKIMLFKATLPQLSRQVTIDPHFTNMQNVISPIARFEPTQSGWEDGYFLAKFKSKHLHSNEQL